MGSKMTFPFQEEIEKLAESFVNRNMHDLIEADARVRHFKLGAQALYELLLKDGGDFNVDACADAWTMIDCDCCYHCVEQGAKWQFEQSQLQIAALKNELLLYTSKICEMEEETTEQKEYITQLENASDTQSKQYHQMREKLEADLKLAVEAISKLCNSMVPHPKEHPGMYEAKKHGEQTLEKLGKK